MVMSLRHASRALAIGAIILFGAAVAYAQEGTVPIPDSSYGESNYQSSTDLTMPSVDDQPAADTVTIPIPGGGEITVDGPDAPSDTSLPTLPGGQWGATALTPYSHDIGPNGP